MTRWAFIIGPGRSGTTLLSNLLNQSSRVYIAPETKYFQQVWSQRHLLRLIPRERRIRAIVDHLVTVEYPANPPTFPDHRDQFFRALRAAPDLKEGFVEILKSLSDRPVVGEKTPWHTFFVDEIRHVVPNARFIAITRDAPPTVASTWKRSGFRRVDSLTKCIARWIFMNQQLLRVRARFTPAQFRLVRFEELIREPKSVLQDLCKFLGVPLEWEMLEPAHQDSSLRPGKSGGQGFDTGALDRWTEILTDVQLQRIRAHTSSVSRKLGYAAESARPTLSERGRMAAELAILRAGVASMRSGFYPFGAATTALRGLVRTRVNASHRKHRKSD